MSTLINNFKKIIKINNSNKHPHSFLNKFKYLVISSVCILVIFCWHFKIFRRFFYHTIKISIHLLCWCGLTVMCQINCAIIPREGSDIGEEEVLRFCRTNLAAFKVPKKVFLTDSVPKTASGKIQRRIVAAHFLEQKSWPPIIFTATICIEFSK